MVADSSLVEQLQRGEGRVYDPLFTPIYCFVSSSLHVFRAAPTEVGGFMGHAKRESLPRAGRYRQKLRRKRTSGSPASRCGMSLEGS